ncbi:hypothetical protein L2735_02195 [Shewanella olleyana]|uniref:sialidase family protein n=1 Tax=Shewanella olleyana TaxID=135626 RepID=UPI00200DC62F|nr:hypothetical protein [Shewanella olleyana]MCL1065621.1 hypothetical protein [Shewanella olleyana]
MDNTNHTIRRIISSFMIVVMSLLSFVTTHCSAEETKSLCRTGEHQLSWSGGGAYPKILSHNNELHLISDVSGIWKSGLNDTNWASKNTGLANLSLATLIYSVSNPLIGYVTTKTGISRTLDGGETWNSVENLPTGLSFRRWDSYSNIIIDEANAMNFYFGDNKGQIFFYHEEVAELITIVPDQNTISTLLLTKDNYLIAGTNSNRYVFQKDPSTSEWKLSKQDSNPALDLASIFFNGKEHLFSVGTNDVLLSTDNGLNWLPLNISEYSTLNEQISTHRISAAVNNQNEISIIIAWYQDWQSGVLISKDSGKTWYQELSNLDYSTSNPTRSWNDYSINKVMSVDISSIDDDTFYFSTYWGIWQSTDSGYTWSENFKNGASNTVGSSIALTDDGDLITASMDVGVIRYPLDKKPISLLPMATEDYFDEDVAGHFWNIVVDSERLIATSSAWSSKANQILISEDNGQTWTRVSEGLPSYYETSWPIWDKGYARALIKDKNISNKLYLGIDGHGLFISTNGGYNWQKSVTKPGSKRIYNGLDQDETTNTLYWGTASNGVYTTVDDGRTWIHDGLKRLYVYDLVVSKSGVVYAGTANSETAGHGAAIYKKESSISEWQLVKDFEVIGAIDALTIDPKNERRVIVSLINWVNNNTGAIYISDDAGTNWSLIPEYQGVGAADMLISPCSDDLFIIGYSQGVKKINLTPFNEQIDLGVNINNFSILKDHWAWKYYESEQARSVWKSGAQIGWTVTTSAVSNIKIFFEAINKPGDRKLPLNYPGFELQIVLNGEVISEQVVKASDTQWKEVNFLLPEVSKGTHTIEILWLNNVSSPTVDTNFALKNIKMIQTPVN